MTFNDQFVFFGKCSYLEKLYLLVLQGFWCDVEKQKLQTIYILTQKNDAAADCVMVHVFILDLAIQFFVFHLQARLKLLQ